MGAAVGGGGGTWQTTFNATAMDSSDSGWGGYTIRQVLSAAQITVSGSKIRVTVEAEPGATGSGGITIDKLYVGHKAAAGDAYDFAGDQVQILFSGGASVALTTNSLQVVSDEATFAIDETKSLLVSAFFSGVGHLGVDTGTPADSYYISGDSAATTNTSGYTAYATTFTFFVRKIEAFA